MTQYVLPYYYPTLSVTDACNICLGELKFGKKKFIDYLIASSESFNSLIKMHEFSSKENIKEVFVKYSICSGQMKILRDYFIQLKESNEQINSSKLNDLLNGRVDDFNEILVNKITSNVWPLRLLIKQINQNSVTDDTAYDPAYDSENDKAYDTENDTTYDTSIMRVATKSFQKFKLINVYDLVNNELYVYSVYDNSDFDDASQKQIKQKIRILFYMYSSGINKCKYIRIGQNNQEIIENYNLDQIDITIESLIEKINEFIVTVRSITKDQFLNEYYKFN